MPISISALLGLLFLLLAVISTYLMFQFWGYPYDKERRKSECPQWKMNVHRAFGYSYVLVYIVMMSSMVPRLWTYQIEFPARTVAHICLGITIGVILLVKISILRWFRHLEEWMPVLGVSLLLCTFLLTGLSLPFVFKEHWLATDRAFTPETRERLIRLLPSTNLVEGADDIDALVSESSLRRGRSVLLNKCTHCHDLKTAISRPRTPDDWFRTVVRMAAKPALGQTLAELDQQQVTAYLVAITPELQESAKALRKATEARRQTHEALADAKQPGAEMGREEGDAGTEPEPPAPRPGAAELAFQSSCSLCHDLSEVDDVPPGSKEDVDELLARMVDNGLEAEVDDLDLIKAYLIRTYVEEE